MIGLLTDLADMPAAQEFFELFKTPWEKFEPKRSYDVLLATTEQIPETDARVVFIYGTQVGKSDQTARLIDRSDSKPLLAEYKAGKFPLYGDVLGIRSEGGSTILNLPAEGEVVGARYDRGEQVIYRFGFDLFKEVAFVLTTGQPAQNAVHPTLDHHIALLRDCILDAGAPLVEIPPKPAGHPFMVCLTHDIDFVGIRNHRMDHTCLGFLYRATVQTAADFLKGKASLRKVMRNWRAVLVWPLVLLGWAKDFWMTFDWYLRVENGLKPTYFFIPFKGRPGQNVQARHPARRAAPYELEELQPLFRKLQQTECEIGVHGIDAWHSAEKGREELQKVSRMTNRSELGIRMHWLLRDKNTYTTLERAGFDYDSTAGYNQTVGYFCGTGQAWRPLGLTRLMELPLHIQDNALFYQDYLGLTETSAAATCRILAENARVHGGVLTVLWHDRSPAPERCWDEFYQRLVADLKAENAWFASASEAVEWFRSRRAVKFERIENGSGVRLRGFGSRKSGLPGFVVKVDPGVHAPDSRQYSDRKSLPAARTFAWSGEKSFEIDAHSSDETPVMSYSSSSVSV